MREICSPGSVRGAVRKGRPYRDLRLPVARDHRPLERAGRVKGGGAGEPGERTLDPPEHSSTLRFTTAVRDNSTNKRAPSVCLDRLAVLVCFTQQNGEAYQNALGRHRPMMPTRRPVAAKLKPE